MTGTYPNVTGMTKTNEYGEEIETFRRVAPGWYQSPNYTIMEMPMIGGGKGTCWNLYFNPEEMTEYGLPAMDYMEDKFLCWFDTLKAAKADATVEGIKEFQD
jgi:hypothetical protein